MEKNKNYEGKFNSRFSREPVYGEGVRTFEEEGRGLLSLQEALDNNRVSLIGNSIVGGEIDRSVVAKLKTLDALAMLGASVFCGEALELVTEDGGILVIGDNCVIYNTTIKVAKGAVLMIENSTLLASEITVNTGQHKIINSNLLSCKVENSTLTDIESKESDIKSSLIKDAHFKAAGITRCVGSAGGSEIGGIYQNKSISYSLDPTSGKVTLRVEELA